MINFGPATKSKLLILDMDETLLHSVFKTMTDDENIDEQNQMTLQNCDDGSGFEFSLALGNKDAQGRPIKLLVKVRPHLEPMLDYLSKYYELCVFTAGEQGYADAVLDYLDPKREIFQHRLYRQHCVKPANGIYVKDLRIIADRNLKDMVIVDNSIISFAFNMENGVPIAAFTG